MAPGEWIALGGLALLIGTPLFKHIMHDIQTQADMRSRIERIERDIGTHETGLRGEMHRQVNMISRLRAIVYFVARKLNLDIMQDLNDDK